MLEYHSRIMRTVLSELVKSDMADPTNTRVLFCLTSYDDNNKRVASWCNGDPLELIRAMRRDVYRINRGQDPLENSNRPDFDTEKAWASAMREMDL